jgi:WD40 repeat protein
VTVGGDNTLRQFDIRDLTKSDILYDRDNNDPFVRVCWNKKNSNQIAMISLISSKILIFDKRNTYGHLKELTYHTGRVNNIAWCPTQYSGKNQKGTPYVRLGNIVKL